MSDDRTHDIKALLSAGSRDFSSVALWNMRPINDRTPAVALAITAALRTHGRMDERGDPRRGRRHHARRVAFGAATPQSNSPR